MLVYILVRKGQFAGHVSTVYTAEPVAAWSLELAWLSFQGRQPAGLLQVRYLAEARQVAVR